MSLRTIAKQVGVYRQDLDDLPVEKFSINEWLAELAGCLLEVTPDASSMWSLLLETGKMHTISALQRKCARNDGHAIKQHFVVPNPDASECKEIANSAQGAHVFKCTSHTLISQLVPKPSVRYEAVPIEETHEQNVTSCIYDVVENAQTDLSPQEVDDQAFARSTSQSVPQTLTAAGWRHHFDFAWLDYCGTLDSFAGRRRQEDIANLLSFGLLVNPDSSSQEKRRFSDRVAILAVTLSVRGGSRLYEGELADGLVVCVKRAARDASVGALLLGLVSYNSPSSMVTACFFIHALHEDGRFDDAGTRCMERFSSVSPPAGPSLYFEVGEVPMGAGNIHRTWTFGRGLNVERPLLVAAQRAAAAFAEVCRKGSTTLVLEGCKTLPVTRALMAKGVSVRVGLPGTLDAAIAQHLSTTFGLSCSVEYAPDLMKDVLSSQSPHAFEGAWLSYERGRSCTGLELRECFKWVQLQAILSRRLLALDSLLAISVAVVGTAEFVCGQAVDWLVDGATIACSQNGYTVISAAAIRYEANAPRIIAFLKLGAIEHANVPVLEDFEQAKPPVKGWEYVKLWQETRPITPTAEIRRHEVIVPYLSALLTAAEVQLAYLHEPGFSFVAKALRDVVRNVVVMPSGDNVARRHAARLGFRTLEEDSFVENDDKWGASKHVPDAIIIIEDCGVANWWERWKHVLSQGLSTRFQEGGSQRPVVVSTLLCGGSDAVFSMSSLKEHYGSFGMSVEHDVCLQFKHSARKWIFVASVLSGHTPSSALLSATRAELVHWASKHS